jgi:GntR family transcriptional regulator, transcriptional repressor for pyruvate dehydrogenase complex
MTVPTDTPFRPVTQRRAFEAVIFQVEEAITDGRLQPGDRLPPERELAQQLQVSRASVREALRVLEAFGIVTARRGRGADAGSVVTRGDHSGLAGVLRISASLLRIPLGDLVDVRVAIEAMTARAAAERGAAHELTEIAKAMQDVTDRGEFLELDTSFHVELARASANALAPMLMEALREAIARQMRAAFEEVADWDDTRESIASDHRGIADAIAARDPEAAEAAVVGHIRNFYALLHEGRGGAAITREETHG